MFLNIKGILYNNEQMY